MLYFDSSIFNVHYEIYSVRATECDWKVLSEWKALTGNSIAVYFRILCRPYITFCFLLKRSTAYSEKANEFS